MKAQTKPGFGIKSQSYELNTVSAKARVLKEGLEEKDLQLNSPMDN